MVVASAGGADRSKDRRWAGRAEREGVMCQNTDQENGDRSEGIQSPSAEDLLQNQKAGQRKVRTSRSYEQIATGAIDYSEESAGQAV